MQPFEAYVTEISICFLSGRHYRCSVTLVRQQAMRSSENSSTVTWRTSQSNDTAS